MTKTLWISHRGDKRSAVENTLAAFRAAVASGFTALETDLRLSADGHIVLHHDPTLWRLAGDRRELARLTRAELASISLVGGGRLGFFEEFLQEFPGCNWVFDIKPETGAAVIEVLYKMAQARGLSDWLLAQAKFVTWTRHQERLLLDRFPQAACYARESECWRAGLSLVAGVPKLMGLKPGRTYALPPRLGRINLYSAQTFGAFRREKAKVIAFLPESAADIDAAVRFGVDEILTNGQISSIETK